MFPIAGVYPICWALKKQRFLYKVCESSFIAKTSTVEEHCFVSNHTKGKNLIKSADELSLTDIAKYCNVLTTIVHRVITEEVRAYKPYYSVLPKHLSFDEFKYVWTGL